MNLFRHIMKYILMRMRIYSLTQFKSYLLSDIFQLNMSTAYTFKQKTCYPHYIKITTSLLSSDIIDHQNEVDETRNLMMMITDASGFSLHNALCIILYYSVDLEGLSMEL